MIELAIREMKPRPKLSDANCEKIDRHRETISSVFQKHPLIISDFDIKKR